MCPDDAERALKEFGKTKLGEFIDPSALWFILAKGTWE